MAMAIDLFDFNKSSSLCKFAICLSFSIIESLSFLFSSNSSSFYEELGEDLCRIIESSGSLDTALDRFLDLNSYRVGVCAKIFCSSSIDELGGESMKLIY